MVDASNAPLNRKLRMGLIGGGGAGFIGKVHALAATLDLRAELVAGAFSSNADRSRASAAGFGVNPERAYGSPAELFAAEAALPEDERVDFVSIATPNATHFEIAKGALEAGFHVVCDKPMTVTLEEARILAQTVRDSKQIFALTHNYSGYPLVREARDIVRSGQLGDLLAVRCNYFQGWLNMLDLTEFQERGGWKSDPKQSGPSGSLGDIGTHAFHLIRYITGWRPTQLACTMRQFHPQRPLDDYGQIQLRDPRRTLGSITYSQMSHGRLNDLTIEIDGSLGSLSWSQERPNQLHWLQQGQPSRTWDTNATGELQSDLAAAACRIPAGHPEGFLEAFANVYRAAFDDMINCSTGTPTSDEPIYPTVDDGLEGVAFMAECLTSHQQDGSWVDHIRNEEA